MNEDRKKEILAVIGDATLQIEHFSNRVNVAKQELAKMIQEEEEKNKQSPKAKSNTGGKVENSTGN